MRLLLALLSSVVGKSASQITEVGDVHPNIEVEPLSSSGWIREPRRHDDGNQKSQHAPFPYQVKISSSSTRISNGEAHRNHKAQLGISTGKVTNKRQIIIQDAAQYLGAQRLLTGQADSSPLQSTQGVYYAQQHPQEYIVQQDAVSGLFYGTPSPIQFQTVTASPVSGQNQLLVLQQNGNSYSVPNLQSGNPQQPSKFLSRTGESEQTLQGQIQADSIGTPVQIVSQPQMTLIGHSDANAAHDPVIPEQKSQQQVQYEEAQQILQNIIKEQALEQTQQQRQQEFQQHQAEQQHRAEEHSQQQAAQVQIQVAENHQSAVLLSPSAATILQAHGHQNPQFIQIQQQPELPAQRIYQGANGQTYIVHHQNPPTHTAEERESTGHSSPAGNYVIRHQTYVAGPGGQMFTVPVPVQQTKDQNSREEDSAETSEDEKDRRDQSGSEESEREESEPHRPISSFMRRIMDAFSVRGDASERVGTNIALPVLASTGVFFGLGALAAGWYLSNGNREVGILRRTGKPVPQGMHNVQRIRRQAPGQPSEVDQSTFFQTIIQQAIEKQQEQHESADEPQSGTIEDPQPQSLNKYGRRKPLNRNDMEEEVHTQTSPNSKLAQRPIHHKSWGPSRKALNFAKVAIPAIILGGAVIAIGVVIFGWYITGSNREIAFLEPSAYSRRKRDLTTTAPSNGWVQRVLTSIHENPYERNSVGGATISNPFSEADTSKHNLEYHANNISDTVVAVSLALVALLSFMTIVFAWLDASNDKSRILYGSSGIGGWLGNYRWGNGKSKRFRASKSLHFSPLHPGCHFF